MTPSAQVHTVARNEGASYWFLGTLITLKASAQTTNGAFSLIEQVAPVGFAPPRHVHHAEDEAFYILDGELTFFLDEQTLQAPTGTYVYLPRGVPHSFRVGGTAPARLLQWTYPAGLEQFFVESGVPTNDLIVPPPAPAEVVQEAIRQLLALAPNYKLEILGPPPGIETH
jgi:quercetin dioxygenase-like cupin family protein